MFRSRKEEDALALPQLDPGFAVGSSGEVRLSVPCDADEVARVLAYSVARDPADVKSHVQRIFWLIDQDRAAQLGGALADLFIALGDKGRALRSRMLRVAAPHLSPVSNEFLQSRLGGELREADLLPEPDGSVLTSGYVGQATLTTVEHQGQGFASALIEARSCIDYGQVDEARTILEDELLANPHDLDVEHELMTLYRHMRDADAVRQFIDLLEDRRIQPSPRWRGLQAELEGTA